MRAKDQPFVIAISGVSGGGKTTVTKHLIEKLHHSQALYFDDYDFDGPEDIITWVEKGADYNLWDLTPLIDDLKVLCNEQLSYIVLDFPFAYKHFKMSKYIDLAIHIDIDTPLDIALARRLTRDFKTAYVIDILSEMEHYIFQGRKGYVELINTIKPNSDIIVDGAQPVSEVVNHICEQLK